MLVEIDESLQALTARLQGDIRWNDRLLVALLATHLRRTEAPVVVLDASRAREQDTGSLAGLRATFERMARLEGKRFSVVSP